MALSVKPRLGTLVKYQIPQHLREDKDQLIKFLQYYYNWCEQKGQAGEFLNNLIYYKDVDHASHFFADLVWGYYTKIFPEFASADKQVLVKNVREFFRAKGTYPSYQFIMQAIFNEEVSLEWLSNKVFRASANEFARDCLLSVDIGPETSQDDGFERCLGVTLTQEKTRAKGKIERVTTYNHAGRKIQIVQLNDKTIRGTFLPFISVYSNDKVTKEEVTGVCSPAITQIDIVDAGAMYSSGLRVKTYGGSGEGMNAFISDVTAGSVDEVIIINKGRNYEIGDLITSNDRSAGGEGFEAVIEKIDGIGAVATLNQVVESVAIVNSGYGYKVGDKLYISQDDLNQDTAEALVEITVASVTNDPDIKGFVIERNSDIAYNVCKPVLYNHDTNALVPAIPLVAEIAKTETFDSERTYRSGQIKSVGFQTPGTYNAPSSNITAHLNGFGARAECILTTGSISAIRLVQGGFNYVNPVIVVAGDGNGAFLTPILTNGVITDITIVSAGSGYTVAPKLIIKEADFIGPTCGGGAVIVPSISSGQITAINLATVNLSSVNYDKGGSGFSDPIVVVDHPSGTGFDATVNVDKMTGSVTSITVNSAGSGYESPAPKIRIVERVQLGYSGMPYAIVKPIFDNSASQTGHISSLSITNKGSITKINRTKNVPLLGGKGIKASVDVNVSPTTGMGILNGGKYYHFNYQSDIYPNTYVQLSGGIGGGAEFVFTVDDNGTIEKVGVLSGGTGYSKASLFRVGHEKPLPQVGVAVEVGDKFFVGNNRFVVSSEGVITSSSNAELSAYALTVVGGTISPTDSVDLLQFTYTGEVAQLNFVVNENSGSVSSVSVTSGGSGYNDNASGVVALYVQEYGHMHGEYTVSGDSTGTLTSASVLSGGFGYYDPATEIVPLMVEVSPPATGRTAKVHPYLSSDGMVSGVHIIDAGEGYDGQNPPTLMRIGGYEVGNGVDEPLPATVNVFDGRIVGITIPDNATNGLKYGTFIDIVGNGSGAEVSAKVDTGITSVSILNAGNGDFSYYYFKGTKPTITINDPDRTSPVGGAIDATFDIEINTLGNIESISIINGGSGYVSPTMVIQDQGDAEVSVRAKRNISLATVENSGSGYDIANATVYGDGAGAKIKLNVDVQGGVTNIKPLEYVFAEINANDRISLYSLSFNGYADIDLLTSTITSVGHNFSEGQAVRLDNNTNQEIDGLHGGSVYYIIDTTNDTFRLADTPTSTYKKILASGDNAIYKLTGSGFEVVDGQPLKFDQRIAPIAGLVDGTTYFATLSRGDSFSLATTMQNAFNGVYITLPTVSVSGLYGLISMGYGYSSSPRVEIIDGSGYGAISKVKVTKGGYGYKKLPYLNLPSSTNVDPTPRSGGKVIAASKSIGRIKSFSFDSFGYGYQEPPMISLPLAATMYDSTGFKSGEKIFIDGYPYNNRDIMPFIRDRNPILVSNVILDEGIPVTVHSTGSNGLPVTEEVFDTMQYTTAVIYLQNQGFNLLLEQDDENDLEPDNLLYDTITPLNTESWDDMLQEDGGLLLTDAAFALFQDDESPKATTSSLGIVPGIFVRLESAETELNGSWEVIGVTDFAFTIKIINRVFGAGNYNDLAFDLDKVEILLYENGPSGVISQTDGATHSIVITDATDLLVLTTEDGLEIIDESESVNLEHEYSYEIPKNAVITGTKSGFSSQIMRSARAQGLAKSGGSAFNAPRFVNSVGILDSSESLIHNNERIQDFAYIVSCGLTLDQYENVLKKTVHPAGYKMFGKIVGEIFTNVPNIKLPIQDKYGSSYGQELLLTIIGGLGESVTNDYKTEKFMYANRMNNKFVDMSYLNSQIGLFDKPINAWDFNSFGDHIFDNTYEAECEITTTYTKSGDYATISYVNDRFGDWWDKDSSAQDGLSREYAIRMGMNLQLDFAGTKLLRKVYSISQNNFVVKLDGASVAASGTVKFINETAFDSIENTPIAYSISTGADPEGNHGYWNLVNHKIRLYGAYDGGMNYTYLAGGITLQTGEAATLTSYGKLTLERENHGLVESQNVFIEFGSGSMTTQNGFYRVYEVQDQNNVVLFAPDALPNTNGTVTSIMIDVMAG